MTAGAWCIHLQQGCSYPGLAYTTDSARFRCSLNTAGMSHTLACGAHFIKVIIVKNRGAYLVLIKCQMLGKVLHVISSIKFPNNYVRWALLLLSSLFRSRN